MKSNVCIALGVGLGLLACSAQLLAQPVVPQVPAESAAEAQQRLGASPRVSPRQRAVLKNAVEAEAGKATSTSFLAQNAKAPGVKVLANGVQYKVLKEGSGRRPQITSTVRCRLTGTLVNGTSFEKIDEKAGASLVVKGLVSGLQTAVTSMPVGATWQVVVPPNLGYGARGTHGVPPNAVLIYQFELLAVK